MGGGQEEEKIYAGTKREQKGDVGALVRGMRTYATHSCVQEKGCEALSSLAANNAKIAELGGIDVILEAMRTHRGHAGVQEQGCCALLLIGWSRRDLQKQLQNAGAEAVVKGAMSASGATDATKEKGQQLLDRLGRV